MQRNFLVASTQCREQSQSRDAGQPRLSPKSHLHFPADVTGPVYRAIQAGMRRPSVDFVIGCGISKAAIIRAGDDAAAAIIHHPALSIARKDPLVKFLPPTNPVTPITGYEDLSVGQSFALGSVELAREDIFEFARVYDPQPFHLDEEAAERSIFKSLAASGFQTISMAFGLGYRSGLLAKVSMGGSGVEEARWLKPVRPDQVLSLTWTIESIAPSRSRPDRATVRIRTDLTDPSGEGVLRMVLVHILAAKAAAAS